MQPLKEYVSLTEGCFFAHKSQPNSILRGLCGYLLLGSIALMLVFLLCVKFGLISIYPEYGKTVCTKS
ncbi:uncharacterized protein CYBJADRAFT_82834 [Cyberlindnera jadinii NRRL Y-1542]|uniref:Uncharacterized protein n=1 Tax=Cyberlindnera jadinii (strain ATCC 18201 / CBS 1600 / BCRC 20928 / JCM 3617 / NBRC 0987 / NRRL Y-1542) TaxID=983966 RepID=A0A1E4S3K3_CYBJN|nr:hypothetical protein CYBJADRAFT_82834 [Cyberlindnera jadinii NRRL Y-1542]ODV74098.1 hypothetical protein CYBJADRAFT_82834 [Cyberlindnera jadinii NRRL Y-1542]